MTRIIQIEDIYLLKGTLTTAWSLPYQEYMAFRLITLDCIENLAYIVCETMPIVGEDGQHNDNYMISETMEFVKYVVDSLSIKLAQKNAATALKKLC